MVVKALLIAAAVVVVTGSLVRAPNPCASMALIPDLGLGPSTRPADNCEVRLPRHALDVTPSPTVTAIAPIVIALDADTTYRLTSPDEGVGFDIDGDGVREKVAWPDAGSGVAFLALDGNGDGRITNGGELVTERSHPEASNAFAALRRMAIASNGGQRRGAVSDEDPLFARLLLWTDANRDGTGDPDELRPARESIAAIGLGYTPLHQADRHGNLYRFQGWVHVRTAPGRNSPSNPIEDRARVRSIYTVYLVTRGPQ